MLALLFFILDITGTQRQPLHVTQGKASVLFFITNDCPIANSYAPEIARICASYKTKGDAAARRHAEEFHHGDYPKIVDRHHELVKATGVTITPEAAVIDRAGKVVYRGRIDDAYASIGQPRRPPKTLDLRNALDAIIAGNPIPRPETQAIGCYIADLP
jgi:hypothetical protein